jgi:multisubunit Na+/H+ antiporter MnhC subunit
MVLTAIMIGMVTNARTLVVKIVVEAAVLPGEHGRDDRGGKIREQNGLSPDYAGDPRTQAPWPA